MMWDFINYAQIGKNHLKENIPCQDKTLVNKENDVYFIGLADGAGSVKYSDIGANQALQSIQKYICFNFDMVINNKNALIVKKLILNEILMGLRFQAENRNCDLKQLASTILFVAIKKDLCIICHLGDGVIGALKNHKLIVVSKPQNGEFSNTTVFTTSIDALSSMRLFKGNTKDIEGFVLMSDGTANSFYQKKTNMLAPVIAKIIETIKISSGKKIQKDLEESFDIVINNTQDDCSIAFLVKNENKISDYWQMNIYQKIRFWNLSYSLKSKKRVKKYELIIYYWNEGKSKQQIARILYIKPKYIMKYLNRYKQYKMII